MRLTITCDPRRRALRVHVKQALDYPPGHVPGLLAAAVTEALAQPPADVEAPELVPAPRTAWDGQASVAGAERREARRGAVAAAGAARAGRAAPPSSEAAREFGLDPAQIDRWDDDPAIDARTDLLGAGPGGHRPARVAS
ncbi:MAG: hypothetical protein WKF40_12065 [Thermoleophilaceae bacterium]